MQRVGHVGRRAAAGVAAFLLLVAIAGCTDDSAVADSSEGPPLLTDFPAAFDPTDVRPEPMPQPPNAGFEGGLSDGSGGSGGGKKGGRCPEQWSCERTGGPETTLDDDTAKQAEKALRVRFAEPDGNFRLTSERLDVRNGRRIDAQVRLRSSIRGEGAESLILRFYDTDGTRVATEREASPKHGANTWYTASISTDVPSEADTMTVAVEAGGYDREVWFDGVHLEDHPRVEVWGGTGLRSGTNNGENTGARADGTARKRSGGGASMTLQLRTPSEDGVYIQTVEAFGNRYHVAGPNTLMSEEGHELRYELDNGPRYDQEDQVLRLPKGQTGSIRIQGDSLRPTSGEGFPKVVLVDPVNEERYHVWVAVKDNANDTEQLRSVVRYVYADKLSSTVRGLSDYLDGRRRSDGGWQVAHPSWPSDPQPDPMAIARVVQGYVFLTEVSGDPKVQQNSGKYRKRAQGGLDWLVDNQHEDGGFGLPWEFGSSQGHLGGWEHYPGRSKRAHSADHPYAISTAIAGEALLDGYRTFDDERYLKAAEKVADYLLKSDNGFQWVNKDQTRGSIPYCTLEPVMPADDPRVRDHDVVQPLKNTAIEVYNIDGASLSFLSSLYEINEDDELLRYGDALARNLTLRMHDSGAMPYAWYHQHYYSGGYPRIVYNGLREWGQLQGDKGKDWVRAADRGFSWLANERYAALLPTEGYSTAHGLGLSGDNGDYINRLLGAVRDDGSFSGGKKTREDATNFAVLAELLKAIEE